MTTQDLYTQVVTGDITEQKFLYEVRRDINLPFITQHNNFKDTVQILKNKGMISEKQTKESTGKQDVEIIAKTIDMVNPYEYSKGMDFELGLVYDAVGNADLTEDEVFKAQKKVLKNLTNNPSYYTQKMSMEMEGESEYAIEVTAKSMADLEKKNKGKKGKIIREHGEDAERVADVNADSTMLEEDNIDEHGEYADRVADVNADSSPLEEEEVEELGRKRDAIYEKYAQKYGVDVNELKDKVEARKLEVEEAIEVDNEQDAINIQKKSPDADVRIVKK